MPNILAQLLIRMLGDGLANLVKPGGVLIFSGILAEQETQLRTALISADLRIDDVRQIQDWLAIAARF